MRSFPKPYDVPVIASDDLVSRYTGRHARFPFICAATHSCLALPIGGTFELSTLLITLRVYVVRSPNFMHSYHVEIS